jgi:hypothetical protein
VRTARHAFIATIVGACGGKTAPPTTLANRVVPDAAVANRPTAYPDAWGACTEQTTEGFSAGGTVELVDCDVDTPVPEDAPAQPRRHVERLVHRRGGAIDADVELGEFYPWEEGIHWRFGGVLLSNAGSPVALPIYDGGSMGEELGQDTVHAYALVDGEWSEVDKVAGMRLGVELSPDHRVATVHACVDSCTDPAATERDTELTWDGHSIHAVESPSP